MSYSSENNTTRSGKNMLDQLTEMNARGVADMRKDYMPMMVPVQEKDWDTMVSLLQSAVDFQPRVYKLMETLLTTSRMSEMMKQWAEIEQENFDTALDSMMNKLNYQQTAVENLLLQMKDSEQQVGKNLESVMKDSLAKGRELERAIAKASEKTDRRTWIIRTAIAVGASTLASVMSAVLCHLWLM